MIPYEVKIGAVKWKVELFDEADMNEHLADLDYNRLTIRIDGSLPEVLQERFLLHEIIHAINNEMSEEDTDILAGVLHQVLKENDLFNKNATNEDNKEGL